MAKRGMTVWDVHPSVRIMEKWISDLKSKTGKSIDEWVKHIEKSGPKSESYARDWLKTRHELGTNAAAWLAERTFRGEAGNEDTPESYLRAAANYVEAMFSGPKAELRPIFDALVAISRSLGKDVKICPCKTMVPMFRKYAFAQIKPATRTRVDLGLALGPLINKKKLPTRLIDTGGFKKKDRITHRIALTSIDEIDADAKKWLQTAYDLDA
ncbi:MAG: DUF4287 domain-containing protein [Phycisphaerales bacterium]|nr:DUF4287 domain-containing protein [Phycisphaerales bacterium]